MRAFVTGGSGFVGRNLIAALRARGDEVRALSRSDKSDAALRALGAEPVRGDLQQSDALVPSLRGCELVYHAAAAVEQWGPREHFMKVNVEGTDRLCEAARQAGVRRLVHVSTEAVLVGGGPIVRADESRPRAARPIGLYAETKGLAEARVLAHNRDGLETVVVRPRFIWGKGDTTLVPKLAEAVRAGKFAWIGGGRHLTSTCHVRNVCEGALRAAERGRPGEIYFLTDGEPVEVRAFLTALLATAGVQPGDKSIPRPIAYALASCAEIAWRVFHLKGEPPVTRMAVKLIGEEVTVVDDKARRELGYTGAVSRDAGLAEMRA